MLKRLQHADHAERIAANVRAGRARLGMTRKELAAAAYVSERYLHELETGGANASISVITKVATALGQDLLSLIGGAPVATAAGLPNRLQSVVAGMSTAECDGAVAMLEHWLAERRSASKGVALLGLRGAGKSTIGRRFAERHHLPFVSVTREVEARAGMSLNDLFNLGGPDAYRALENEVIAALLERDGKMVLETAGGIAGNGDAMDLILARFKTVWLQASPEEHLNRVARQGDTRPMHGNPKALEHLRALLASREREYARAEIAIQTSGRTVDQCIAALENATPELAASTPQTKRRAATARG